jgi:SAM-dependent methyltransferase
VKEYIRQTLPIYLIPSQSLWRALELAKLKEIKSQGGFEAPILEIGCGGGSFSALLFDSIDVGIDINPRSIERCRQINHVYKHILCMDARAMGLGQNMYQTLFANCVLEHISDLDKVLTDGLRLLRPSGKFVATVPLRDMNRFLVLRSPWYAELRRKQLKHENLLTLHEWLERFQRAGFKRISVYPYLSGRVCYYWDLMDSPMCLGYQRYSAYGAFCLAWRVLPLAVKRAYLKGMSNILSRLKRYDDDTPCAVVLIAQKG